MYTAYYYRLTNYVTLKRKEITDFPIYSRDIYVQAVPGQNEDMLDRRPAAAPPAKIQIQT